MEAPKELSGYASRADEDPEARARGIAEAGAFRGRMVALVEESEALYEAVTQAPGGKPGAPWWEQPALQGQHAQAETRADESEAPVDN